LRYQFGLVTDFALQLLMSVWASSDAYRQERWPLYAEPHPEPPKVLWRLLAVMLAGVALAVVDFAVIRSLKIRAFKMTAASMAPTIRPGDRVMADMGDYRDHSWDSRAPQFGPIRREDIKGKVLYIYWSKEFSRIGRYIR